MTQVPPHPPAPGSEADEAAAEEGRGHPLRLAALAAAVGVLGWFGGLPALAIVGAIVVMIFMHELGHYLTAKAAGMKVTEFFLGFGPRIWSFRRGETEYGLKVIPAGAYVRIIGMNNLDPVEPADEPRTYRQQSYPRRLSVALAGSAMHFLMAFVLAFLALALYGEITEESEERWTVDQSLSAEETLAGFEGLQLTPEFESLLESGRTPATAAGIEEGDRIVAIDDVEIDVFTDMRQYVQAHPGEEVDVTVERDGETLVLPVTLGSISDGQDTVGYLGVGQDLPRERYGVVESVQRSASAFGEITVESLKGIGRFFTPSGLSSFAEVVVAGPDDDPEPQTLPGRGTGVSGEDEGRIISIVGAARIGAEATDQEGMVALLRFMVLLNIFIGIFNLIPLLPLDGGHVAVATYERIREVGRRGRYHADVAKLLPLTYGVVIFMVTIGVMALYADLINPVSLN